MSAQTSASRIAKPRPALMFLTLLLALAALASACTREEVAATMATAGADLQATLEPLSATVEAGGLLSAFPTAVVTAEAPAANIMATVPKPAPTGTAAPLPTLTLPAEVMATVAPTSPTPVPTNTAVPTTPTPVPSPTIEPSPTPVPSPTPLPAQVELGGSTLVLVPGGFFQMGAAAADMLAECETFRAGCNRDWFTASEPAHTVLVAPFYMDQHEVTNVAYLDFLNAKGTEIEDCSGQACLVLENSELQQSDEGGFQIDPAAATNPVTGVTWFGAAEFCEWRDSRLPTEAEWEKAALWNPATEAGTFYPWGDEFDGTQVNFCDVQCTEPQANPDFDDGFATLAPVGSFPGGASPTGVLDMAGNVWEWVADWFSESYYNESATSNPTGPDEGTDRVVRGGSYFDTGNFTSGRIRFPSEPGNSDRTIGFRCAASIQ